MKGRKKQTSIDRICGEVCEDRARVLEVLADHWEGLRKSDGLVFDGLGYCAEFEKGGKLWVRMKFGGRRLVGALCMLLSLVFKFKCVPDEWMRSYVVPLFKAGDPALPGNYRGIALGSCVAKVLAKVVKKLGVYAEEVILSEEQGGFREFLPRARMREQGVMSYICKKISNFFSIFQNTHFQTSISAQEGFSSNLIAFSIP